MDSKREIQHVYLVGAKSLGAYGGYETFVYKLTEYHQNKENIKYHVACKANGDGCMDETKFDGVTKINDHEFEFHNAHCFKIDVPQIGPAQAIYYDVAALKACCEHIKKNHIPHPIVYIMACRIGPFAGHFYREIHKLGGTVFLNPDGHEWMRAKWSAPIRKYWKISEQMMVKYCDLAICDSVNELGVLPPNEYKRANGFNYTCGFQAGLNQKWTVVSVNRILKNESYTGTLIQGKRRKMGRRKKIDVNTTSVRTLPEDKWIIAENAHEAIVTKDEYYQAQKAIRNVTPIQYKVGDDFALKGKICCGNCNRQLRHERQYGEMVFYCGYKRSAGKFSKCYGGYYREYSVNAKVARAIKTVFYALDVVNQGIRPFICSGVNPIYSSTSI